MRRPLHPVVSVDREETLLRRARRFSKKGEGRKAMLAVREACYAAREDARLWALYGVLCYRARRHEEALHALRQSLWLRERAHDTKRAAVLEKLIAQVELGGSGELSAA